MNAVNPLLKLQVMFLHQFFMIKLLIKPCKVLGVCRLSKIQMERRAPIDTLLATVRL